jgi:eukaryotic-like serine/threonine-protein kinase
MQQLVDNRYRLVRPLGSGGMADVYLAHDSILERDVALKVMSTRYASDDEFVERFKREAQSAAALSHANIVSIFDRGESEDGTYYIAMEYLPGGTLKDRIMSKGALPPRTAAAVALQIAEALCTAHERGVIHRDIKPHNILITESGDVKVTDFGIARAASSSTMTRTGSILGTAHYISPEQAMGEPVGPASDLYSLGVVLYEMLTGELPYDAETPLGIAMKHVNGHLQPPKALNPRVPDGINAITCRLLAKDPEDRYASGADLIEDLERVVAGLEPASATTELMRTRAMPAAAAVAPTRVGPPPPPAARRNGKRRNAWRPLLLALLALLLLAPLAWAAYNYLNDQQRQAAMIAVPDLVGMTVEEAQNQVGNDFEIAVQREVRGEDEEGTIRSQQPAAPSRAEEGSTISVVAVGTQIAEVPDVTGEKRDAAEQTLQDADFEVTVEEAESSFEQEGRVTDQSPQGGSSEEIGSQVTITVGTGPATVKVPGLYGNTTDQAAGILADYELELGTVSEDYTDEVSEGQIFYQEPAEGEELEPGSEVAVTVSLGPEQVEIPEVFGLTLEEAQTTLENFGLLSSPVEVEDNERAGTALSTEPGAGALVDPGTTVTLYYSGGPPEPTTASPTTVPPAADEGNGENLRDALREGFQRNRGVNDGNNGGNNGGDNGGNNRGRDRGGGND